MRYSVLIFIFICMIGSNTTAQEELIHYYLKIDGSSVDKFEIEIGTVGLNPEFKPKRIKSATIKNPSELAIKLKEELQIDGTSEIFNVVIHGIWGDLPLAWKEMVQNLSRDIYSTEDSKRKVMLSIIWDSSFNYLTGIKIARKKGDYLSSFFKELVRGNPDNVKVNFLCHSMGNRIFQHMITSSGVLASGTKVIDQYIAAGADLQADIFEEGNPLNGIDKVVNDVTIFVHNNDRSLKMSKLIHKNKRLGLHGIPNMERSPDNFRIIDVSVINDHTKWSSSMSNHRYFYISPTVMVHLKKIIWEKDFHFNKKKLDHPRRLKMLPGEVK